MIGAVQDVCFCNRWEGKTAKWLTKFSFSDGARHSFYTSNESRKEDVVELGFLVEEYRQSRRMMRKYAVSHLMSHLGSIPTGAAHLLAFARRRSKLSDDGMNTMDGGFDRCMYTILGECIVDSNSRGAIP